MKFQFYFKFSHINKCSFNSVYLPSVLQTGSGGTHGLAPVIQSRKDNCKLAFVLNVNSCLHLKQVFYTNTG